MALEHSPSAAITLPPELVKHVVDYVGNVNRLIEGFADNEARLARKEEIRHLSVCALTCVYWAHICREKIFEIIMLQSPSDLREYRSMAFTSPSPRFLPMSDYLLCLICVYTCNHYMWFYGVSGLVIKLRESQRKNRVANVHFRVHRQEPEPPEGEASQLQQSPLRHLSYALPRSPPTFPLRNDGGSLMTALGNIRVRDMTELKKPIVDAGGLWGGQGMSYYVSMEAVTWDTPTSVEMETLASSHFSQHTGTFSDISDDLLPSASATGCTDDVMVVAIQLHTWANMPSRIRRNRTLRSSFSVLIPDYPCMLSIFQDLYTDAQASGIAQGYRIFVQQADTGFFTLWMSTMFGSEIGASTRT